MLYLAKSQKPARHKHHNKTRQADLSGFKYLPPFRRAAPVGTTIATNGTVIYGLLLIINVKIVRNTMYTCTCMTDVTGFAQHYYSSISVDNIGVKGKMITYELPNMFYLSVICLYFMVVAIRGSLYISMTKGYRVGGAFSTVCVSLCNSVLQCVCVCTCITCICVFFLHKKKNTREFTLLNLNCAVNEGQC